MAAAFLTVHFVRWKTKRKEPLAVQVILSRPVNVIPVMGMLEPPKIYWCWSWTVDQRRIRPSHASQQNLQVGVVPISESPYPQPQARPWNGILVFTRLQENVSGLCLWAVAHATRRIRRLAIREYEALRDEKDGGTAAANARRATANSARP